MEKAEKQKENEEEEEDEKEEDEREREREREKERNKQKKEEEERRKMHDVQMLDCIAGRYETSMHTCAGTCVSVKQKYCTPDFVFPFPKFKPIASSILPALCASESVHPFCMSVLISLHILFSVRTIYTGGQVMLCKIE